MKFFAIISVLACMMATALAEPPCHCAYHGGWFGGGGCRIVTAPPAGWTCVCVFKVLISIQTFAKFIYYPPA